MGHFSHIKGLYFALTQQDCPIGPALWLNSLINFFQNTRQLYALVSETLRYSHVLDSLMDAAGLLCAEKKLQPQLAKVTRIDSLLVHMYILFFLQWHTWMDGCLLYPCNKFMK